MKIDAHTHRTNPISLTIEMLEQSGLDKAVICGSGIARGENVIDLRSAEAMSDQLIRAREAGFKDTAEQVLQENRIIAEECAAHYGKLFAFGKIDLRCSESEIREHLDFFHNHSFHGIGEILGLETGPAKLQFLLRENGRGDKLPVFIHTDFPVGVEDIKTLISIAKDTPQSTVIIGHLGGNYWIEAIRGALSCKNVFLEISEAINLIPIKIAIQEVPDKVIFGSDYPWDIPSVNLERLNYLRLDARTQSKVLGETLLQLF